MDRPFGHFDRAVSAAPLRGATNSPFFAYAPGETGAGLRLACCAGV
jgi:hypothetical protein